jgi:Zn finger protein HypA/HybF involved in hydrogenase expression
MTTSITSIRLSAKCARCHTPLIAPEWSECVTPQTTLHIWNCPVCDNEFETVDQGVEPSLSEAELADEFLPNLLVA